jgi:hypothetical protein
LPTTSIWLPSVMMPCRAVSWTVLKYSFTELELLTRMP